MDERIKELSNQAYSYASEQTGEFTPEFMGFYDEKFSELIVRECVDTCLKMAYSNPGPHHYAVMIKEHFGVE